MTGCCGQALLWLLHVCCILHACEVRAVHACVCRCAESVCHTSHYDCGVGLHACVHAYHVANKLIACIAKTFL